MAEQQQTVDLIALRDRRKVTDTYEDPTKNTAILSASTAVKTSSPSSWRQRRAERLARRANTFTLTTTYAALTRDSSNQDGIKEAQDWIEKRLKDLNKDPKFVILLRGPKDGEVIGWGALELDEDSSKELATLSNIQSVVIDERPKKRLIARKRDVLFDDTDGPGETNATKLEKRAFNWDQLAWKKTDAPSHLIDISRWEGRSSDGLDDFVYESQRGKRNDGKGVYIYVIEEGIQMDVKYKGFDEFPNREPTIYTDHCISRDHNNENDEDVESHGTIVASLALGQFHGVAKSATLVSVKFWGELTDMADALYKAGSDIESKGRQLNSIVVLTVGGSDPTDPVKIRDVSPAAADTFKWIQQLHDLGVPVITPAGNDRLPKDNKPGREDIDFWPSNWEGPQYPLINVAETDLDGFRSAESQAGTQVTTWAATEVAWVMRKDGTSDEDAGTSLGCGIVAGVLAGLMALEEQPWGALTGRERVEGIRQFIKNDVNSGWTREKKDDQGNTIAVGERVIWNGAKEAYHQKAVEDPDQPEYPDEQPAPSQEPTPTPTPTPQPPKGDPKSLQIIYQTFVTEGAEKWQAWNFIEGDPGTAVNWCDENWKFHDEKAPEVRGWDAPFPTGEWPLRFNGYAEDCTYQGLGEKRPGGDVGWLHCPEREAIKCLATSEMASVGDSNKWATCSDGDMRFGVAYCDWDM